MGVNERMRLAKNSRDFGAMVGGRAELQCTCRGQSSEPREGQDTKLSGVGCHAATAGAWYGYRILA